MNDGHRGQQSYILDASNTGLGDNVIINGDFSDNSNVTTSSGGALTGWTSGSTHDATNNFTISNGECTIISDGTGTSIRQNAMTSGVTYKYSIEITNRVSGAIKIQNEGVDIIAGLSTVGTHTGYFQAGGDTFTITRNGSCELTFDNVTLQPVNGKNHATTVFYGDELITNGTMEANSNWADYNSVNDNVRSPTQAHSGTYSRKFTVDGSSQGIQSDTFTTVTGRKYLLSFEIYPDDATTARIAIRKGDNSDWADDTSFSGLTQDAWNTKTVTYTETAGGSGAYLVVHGHGNTSGDFYVDDVSIKEVGTASGWTDADQQLNIPQTALQSYNQMLYGFDDTNGDFNAETYVKINDDSALDFGTNNFSASVWIRRDGDYPSHSNVFRKGGWSAIGFSIGFSSSEVLGINFSHTTGSVNYWAYGNTTIEKGKWYHIVGTWDRDGSQQLYVNGEKQTMTGTHDISAKSALSMDSTEDIYINSMSTSTNGHFSGAITEFALFDNVLFGQDQVNELYNDGKALDVMASSQSGNCHGYWRNNGLAQWKDLSGNGNHSNTVVGSETMLITAGADGSRDSQGFLMNRQRTTNSLNLYYDGTQTNTQGPRVYTNSAPIETYTACSFSCWIKSNKLGTLATIFSIGTSDTNHVHVAVSSNGDIAWTYEVGGGDKRFETTNAKITTENTWYYVTAVCNNSESNDYDKIKIYVNGAFEAVDTSGQTGTTQSVTPDSSQFDIGLNPHGGRKFVGQIDDFLIHNKVLDATEVKRNYNAGKRSHK